MISTASLITMCIAALAGFAVPVVFWVVLIKKYKCKFSTILTGACVFVVFALVLESLVHQLVLGGPNGAAIQENVLYYALYGGFMAGLFEETGRFLAMTFLLKKAPDSEHTGIAYGAGHGGIEMMVVLGIGMISNIVTVLLANSGSLDAMLEGAPAETVAKVNTVIGELMTISPATFLIAIWERLSAVVLQLALSVLVWQAVKNGGRHFLLFPLAIFFHFFVDASTVILNGKGVNIVIIETIVMAMAIAIVAITWQISKKAETEK